MTPAWYILASILGGLIVAVATLAGIRLGQGAEDRRMALVDQQRLRDVKAVRLRELYEPLLRFGLLLRRVVHEKGFGMEGESDEERDERHEKEMNAGTNVVGQMMASVIMEPGTQKVRSAYDDAYRACDRYLRSWRMINAGLQQANYESHKKEIAEVSATSEALVAAVQGQLADLERPITIPGRKWWQLS